MPFFSQKNGAVALNDAEKDDFFFFKNANDPLFDESPVPR